MKILDGIFICDFIVCLFLAINNIKADDKPLPCSNKKVLKGAAVNFSQFDIGLWPNGVVYYSFSNDYNDAQKAIIIQGMQLIENKTRINGKDCIKFKQRTTENNYINIFSDQGCYSLIGMNKTGSQPLSLEIGSPATGSCVYPFIAAHELIHALGFDHEQTRPDRNKYVYVNYTNIMDGFSFNFDIDPFYVNLNTPYDIKSIMHYDSTSFAKPDTGYPYTITSNFPPTVIPDPKTVSDIDVEEIRLLYKCGVSNKINWREASSYSWATSCDFTTTDLSTAYVARDKCAATCINSAGCTHFVWVDDKIGGVCYLKSGQVSKTIAQNSNDNGMVCGILKPKDKGRSLSANNALNQFEALVSSNGMFKAYITFNGEFIIQKEERTYFSIDLAAISNAKALKSPYKLTLRSDGNLVITDNTNAIVWQTQTSLRHPKLTMHNNGNLELFNDFTNRVYWASNTTEQVVKIENKKSGYCLSLKNSNQLISIKCDYRGHDRGYSNWGLTKKQDGYYLISNRVTGFYLYDSPTGLGLTQDIPNASQDWTFASSTFVNRATGNALSSDSTHQIFSEIRDTANKYQKWTLI